MVTKIPENILHRVVNESEHPIIFNNILKNDNGEYLWQIFNWNFDEFSEKIGNIKLPFREGINNITRYPQWEYKCKIKYLTINDFLKISQIKESPTWNYFDYKYMYEWFKDNSELLNSINWNALGYDINSETSTLWIGSKGAHTNCHKDTYGNNLVVQIFGRKQWILFPPDTENFRETRNPYEESTIYTKLNLFTPSLEEINHLKSLKYTPRVIILNPGDILFVPHGWWHFVESLDTSCSVNVWFPLKTDCFDRLSEALVKLVVNKIGISIPIASENDKSDLEQCLHFIKQSLTECEIVQNNTDNTSIDEAKCSKNDDKLEDIFKQYSNNMKIIQEMLKEDYDKFLNNRNSRFTNNESNLSYEDKYNNSEIQELEDKIVNAFCNTKIMQQVTKILYSKNC